MKLLSLNNTYSKKNQRKESKSTQCQTDHELLLITPSGFLPLKVQFVSHFKLSICVRLSQANIASVLYQLQMSLTHITTFIPYQLRELQ